MRAIALVILALGCRTAVSTKTKPIVPISIQPVKGPSPDLRERLLESSDGCLPLLVETVWKNRRDELTALASDTETDEGANLYTVQALTATLLMGIERCRRYDLLDDHAAVLLKAFESLRPHAYLGTDAKERSLPTWRGAGEGPLAHPLNVAQFMYPVAVTLRLYAESKEARPHLEALARLAPLVRDHFLAWVLYKRQFATETNILLTQSELVRWKRRASQVDGHATDLDLWILVGAVELLAAHRADPELVQLEAREVEGLRRYAVDGAQLLESRIERTTIVSTSGERVEGATLDPGFYTEDADYRFAGYRGETFPRPQDRAPVPGIGWDISHLTRIVHVFESLRRHRALIGSAFPSDEDVTRFANQYAYRVFNGDPARPLLANYWDGSNGWYRVGFDNRAGFGYQPSDLSHVGLRGAYGFWAELNPDVDRANCALLRMLIADGNDLARHRNAHYGRVWMAGVRRTLLSLDQSDSYELLNFPAVFSGRIEVLRECLSEPPR